MSKISLATVWLDGCSGCHMSFLDLDERLIGLLDHANLVYSPLVDNKEFPASVDVTLVEGAVSSVEDHHKIIRIRERTKILIALGDCAVTANVPSMRNRFKVEDVLNRAYIENATVNQHVPTDGIPALMAHVVPVHEVVKVDVFIPGGPPPADLILEVLTDLLSGKVPELHAKFG
jgi:NAD-reducing hydrogenase small subunit